MTVYELSKEDMTTLGHMGTSPTTEWEKLYSTLEAAEIAGLADYKKYGKFRWTKMRDGRWSSGDLLHVMYDIRKIEVID